MTPAQARRVTILWHDTIVAPAFDQERKKYRCFHCGQHFPRYKVCGDHWPDTKGSRPDLRYDVTAGHCSCGPCNTSGSRHRTPHPMKNPELKKVKKPPLCKKCRIRLAVKNDCCPFCR